MKAIESRGCLERKSVCMYVYIWVLSESWDGEKPKEYAGVFELNLN